LTLRLLFLVFGSALTAFGFLAMRDPARVAARVPGAEDYYLRMLVYRDQRIQTRAVAMFLSFVGLAFFKLSLRRLLRLSFVGAVAKALSALLLISFIAAFGYGLIYLVRQMFIDGGGLPTDHAPMTQMKKERTVFTASYLTLLVWTIIIALVG